MNSQVGGVFQNGEKVHGMKIRLKNISVSKQIPRIFREGNATCIKKNPIPGVYLGKISDP